MYLILCRIIYYTLDIHYWGNSIFPQLWLSRLSPPCARSRYKRKEFVMSEPWQRLNIESWIFCYALRFQIWQFVNTRSDNWNMFLSAVVWSWSIACTEHKKSSCGQKVTAAERVHSSKKKVDNSDNVTCRRCWNSRRARNLVSWNMKYKKTKGAQTLGNQRPINLFFIHFLTQTYHGTRWFVTIIFAFRIKDKGD